MDLHAHIAPPPLINSFDINEDPSFFMDHGKKRKLQHDNHMILPSAKYKFRDRYYDSDDESTIEDVFNADKCVILNGQNKYSNKDAESDYSTKSFWGSNDSDGIHESDMTRETGSKVTISSECVSYYNQPSTSSNSCSNNRVRSSHYSMESRPWDENTVEEMFEPEDLEDESPLEKELSHYKEQLYEFETYSDLLSSEIESNVINHCIDAGCKENLLYPSALASESVTRSLENKPTERKPTIDQEFEQYFSMLML